jgi:hypothetical protein
MISEELKIKEWLEQNKVEKIPSKKFRSSNKTRLKKGSVRRNKKGSKLKGLRK